MSAQAILSMIAPALPATPQGPSVAEASGFGDMLALLLSTGAVTNPAMAVAPPVEAALAPGDAAGPAGEEALPPVEATAPSVEAAVPVVEATAPLVGAAAPLVEETVPPVEETASDDESASSTESETGPAAFLPSPPPVASPPAVSPPVVTNAGGLLPPKGKGEDGITAVAPAPGAGPKPEPGVVQPVSLSSGEAAPAKDSGPRETASGKDSSTAPDAPTEDLAPIPPLKGAATAPTASGEQPEDAPAQAPSPAPAHASPPALRALAERTSKPLDQAAQTDASAKSVEAKPTGSSTPPPSGAATQADKPTTPAAAAAAAPAAALDPGPAPAEAGPAGDPVADRTEAAAPTRDHSLSTLSRAAIDATAQIAAQIQRKLEGRSTRFEIALRPDELGRVDVKLDIDAEGRLAARLAFDNPAAATDLRGRADELRRQLEAAGFHLAEDAFEFAERDSGSSAFDRGQDSRQGQNRAFAAAARLNADIDIAQPPQWLALSLSPSGVDMKV